ncbi:endonuclease/exonuclease/phosphatase family protein [Undibacterium sp. Ji67W]|uniref:endonuclease/exonuclease/phosphatase family protein n=1 Tax=Undibacterium sp. Ji67W TaxID=3413042 RepID=UPI003BF0D1F6
MRSRVKLLMYLCFLVICFSKATIVLSADRADLTVATYNLRFNNPDDGLNAWANRKEMVKGLIRFHDFDLFGTQEGLIDQLNDLADMKEFSFVGVGRDDGVHAGEHSAIFYKKERFKLLKNGDYWLSQTPDHPSLGWDATCCKRIASWAKFRDLKSKKEFYFFSVHFDHQGVLARRESAKLMIKKIHEIAGDSLVVSVGDLNSTPDTEQVRAMQSAFHDAAAVSLTPAYGPVATFNAFRIDIAPVDRIDYIFVSDHIRVLKYGVLTDSKEQRYPSDHFPVMAKIAFF